MNQKGYARLYGVLTMITVIVISVLIYQSIVYRVDQAPTEAIVRNPTRAQLFVNNLPSLPRGAYELWVQTESDAISLGKFQVNENKDIVTAQGVIEDGIFYLPQGTMNLEGAYLTLSEGLNPRTEQNVVYLTGDLDSDRVSLQFQTNFAEASGQFMLATPTDNDTLVNEKSGLWFGDVLQNQPKLNLPDLPDGWVYEAWLNTEGRTLTAGSFSQADEPDLFNGFSDTKGASPQFPGEDFLKNPPVAVFPDLEFPLDITGELVQISVEPRVDGEDPLGAGQFPHVILQQNVSGRVQPYTLVTLELADNLPTALVVFR